MRYLKVAWHHTSPDDPVIIWSEIGEDGYEVRKVEQFADGRLGYADASTSVGGSELGEFPVPEVATIAQQKEFSPETISAKAFARKWIAARSPKMKSAKSSNRAKVRLRTSKGASKRNLTVLKTRRGWSVMAAGSRRVIVTLKTRDAALEWAREALRTTKSSSTRIAVTGEKVSNVARERKK
ncbi:hypothetical protein AB0F03_06305 [Streptomyces sp. NPDC028722]|uniref:DUF6881 domain-containing protein n=1 Tax=Streptomyces sp. NPDC028722 TaxID=3155016 RepID=UPI0033C5F3FC